MSKNLKDMTKAELIAYIQELEKLVPVPDIDPKEALGRFLVAWNDDPTDTVVGFCGSIDDGDSMPYSVAYPNGGEGAWFRHARLATLEEVEDAGLVLPVSGKEG